MPLTTKSWQQLAVASLSQNYLTTLQSLLCFASSHFFVLFSDLGKLGRMLSREIPAVITAMAFIVHGASPFPGAGQGIGSDLIIHQPTVDLALDCATCIFKAEAHEELRDHYKTEWHRHNLKRKVAGLAPIGLADFEVEYCAARF